MEEEKVNENETSSKSIAEKTREWVGENLRIIASIIIVVIIAGGIYSYSKRGATPEETSGDIAQISEEQLLEELKSMTEDEEEDKESAKTEEIIAEETTEEVPATEVAETKTEVEKEVTSTETSRETENFFIESAQKGEGTTHLARRALANYLEKNPDSELTAEHKIYIEDYLRKKVGFTGRVYVGTTVEFSKDLINEAITQSKNLNEKQLKNLEKYSQRVPSLS